ncbi:MAG: ATP-binding protein, partial [Candidatus Limnocylindrales bacterium]
ADEVAEDPFERGAVGGERQWGAGRWRDHLLPVGLGSRREPRRRGTGLGLAIVEEFARAHGGRAFAENLAGGGARVGVVLPALSAGHPAPSTGALPVPSSPS